MNNNTTTQPLPDFSGFYINEKIRLSLVVLIVFAGLIGNPLVAILILTKKTRRTNDHIFLLNLACADFLNIAFDTARFVVHLSYLRDDNASMKTLMYCKIFWAILKVPFCAGIFTITAMSLHRCWVILNPYKPKIRLLWINLCVLSTWVIGIIFYLPITISAVNHGYICVFPGWSAEDKRAYSIASAIVQYPLPLVVITIAYLKIGIYLRGHRDAMQSMVTRGSETQKNSIAMTKTVGVIVLLFAVHCLLFLPLNIGKVAYYYGVYEMWVYALWDYGDVFSSMHSAINPYVYTIRTPECRKHILSWFRRRPSISPVITQAPRRRVHNLTTNCASSGEMELNRIDASKSKEVEKEKELTSNTNGYDTKL